MESLYLIGVAVLALFAFILCIILFNFFGLWIRARIANAPVGLGKMVGMRLRKVPVGMIVDNRITAVKAGIDIPSDPLEAHYLAGGDVSQVRMTQHFLGQSPWPYLPLRAELVRWVDGL